MDDADCRPTKFTPRIVALVLLATVLPGGAFFDAVRATSAGGRACSRPYPFTVGRTDVGERGPCLNCFQQHVDPDTPVLRSFPMTLPMQHRLRVGRRRRACRCATTRAPWKTDPVAMLHPKGHREGGKTRRIRVHVLPEALQAWPTLANVGPIHRERVRPRAGAAARACCPDGIEERGGRQYARQQDKVYDSWRKRGGMPDRVVHGGQSDEPRGTAGLLVEILHQTAGLTPACGLSRQSPATPRRAATGVRAGSTDGPWLASRGCGERAVEQRRLAADLRPSDARITCVRLRMVWPATRCSGER